MRSGWHVASKSTQIPGEDMYAAPLAANAGHPAVAALLGLGAAGLAGAVVAMAWTVHARQIRLAERLARRQFVTMVNPAAGQQDPPAPAEATTGRVNGAGPASPANGVAPASGGPGHAAPVVIDGPDIVVTGEQVRYRVQPSGNRKVVAWAVGGGSVSQSPDPAHPDELLLIADRPGNLTLIVRVRDGMTERRGTKAVTAVPEVAARPPFTLRLFLNGWGLVAVAILIAGFAASLDALGNLSSSDFIALVSPLAALLAVVAVARGRGEPPAPHSTGKGTDRLAVHAARAAEPVLPGPPHAAEAPVHNQPAL